jgi:putative sugar O-methyltransferase
MNALDKKIIEQIDEMSRCLFKHKNRNLYGAAPFWESLSHKHELLIKNSGFNKFKQTINFEYHQYEVASFKDRKIRNLFFHLIENFKLPYGIFLTKVAPNVLRDVPKIRANFSFNPKLYAIFMGLLWQYALIKDKLGCLNLCEEPLIGEPIPVYYHGKLISQDLATSSIELNCLAKHIDMANIKRVAEIGAGYGRLAYVAALKYPQMKYCIFDIPPALAISQNYLTLVLGEETVQMFSADTDSLDSNNLQRIKAFLPHQLEYFPDRYFDLIINISSFDEMMHEQVENYFSLIDQKCKGWLYVKGHETAPEWCQVSGGGLAELPYKTGWKLEYHGKDPFIANFVERIFSLHPHE